MLTSREEATRHIDNMLSKHFGRSSEGVLSKEWLGYPRRDSSYLIPISPFKISGGRTIVVCEKFFTAVIDDHIVLFDGGSLVPGVYDVIARSLFFYSNKNDD